MTTHGSPSAPDVLALLTEHDPLRDRRTGRPDTAEAAALARARRALDVAVGSAPDGRSWRWRPVRRLPRWSVVAAPAVAAAVVAVVVVSLPGAPQPAPSTAQPVAVVQVQAGDAGAAPVFLGELATAVAATTAPVPRPDQFVYVRSLTASIDLTPAYEGTGPAVDEGLVGREVWLSQDPAGGSGLIREDGTDTPLNPDLGGGASPSRYAALAALPTDPQVLLDRITATAVGSDVDPSFAAFTAIRDLLAESLAPPATTAALYRATALVPGVELVPGAQDAAGRTGVGIALTHEGQRTELVFDAATGSYLGSRSYLVADSSWGRAGSITDLTAVLARGVSSTPGQVPTGGELLD